MIRRPPDNHYGHPTLASVYDTTCGWSPDRDFYLSLADRDKMAILDIGCGTGLLCNAYAERGHIVVGVDPSATMLDIASRQPNGAQVKWVEGYAQEFECDQVFDLAIMTGHTFQTLLAVDDVNAALRNIRTHLRPEGRFVFESRNPFIDWVMAWDGRSESWSSEFGNFTQSTRVINSTVDTVSFEHTYEFEAETLSSTSELWFMSKHAIETALGRADFSLSAVYGDWDRSHFDTMSSLEMIFDSRCNVG